MGVREDVGDEINYIGILPWMERALGGGRRKGLVTEWWGFKAGDGLGAHLTLKKNNATHGK